MGRPKQHDEHTRAALRAAAEHVVAQEGISALSIRTVAEAAGTTTRAVYSVFGSKDGLIDALAQTAFEFLASELERLPETPDPIGDLLDVGVNVFRRLALEHPALYRIAFQRVVPALQAGPELVAARQRAFAQLHRRIARLESAGLLRALPVADAAVAFEAMMEGLANAELRGRTLPILPAGEELRAWRDALWLVVRAFRGPTTHKKRAAPRRGPSRQ